jgi:hypothetical protein
MDKVYTQAEFDARLQTEKEALEAKLRAELQAEFDAKLRAEKEAKEARCVALEEEISIADAYRVFLQERKDIMALCGGRHTCSHSALHFSVVAGTGR